MISQINGLCLAQFVVCGARVASPPRVDVVFELVRALAYELRRAGEGPSLGGRDEGDHDVGIENMSFPNSRRASPPLRNN